MYMRPRKPSHLDTVKYEMDMLHYCFNKVVESSAVAESKDGCVYLECFLLHYRNLLRFFSGNGGSDELSVAKPERWWSPRTLTRQETDSLKKKAIPLYDTYWGPLSQYVEHLTVQRHEQDRDWDVRTMYDQLRSILSQFQSLTQQGEPTAERGDPFLGMMADEPELADRVVESAMSAREEDPLRRMSG